MKRLATCLYFLFFSSIFFYAQQNTSFVFEPGYSAGIIIPVHSDYPSSKGQQNLDFSFSWLQTDTLKPWANFYNYPQTGFSLILTDYGNPQQFGQSASLIPHITIRNKNRLYKNSHFRIGLGASRFTKKYEWPENKHNWSIGSLYTWTFVGGYYFNFKLNHKTALTLGAQYMHSSNSHVQLPNFGLNTFMLSTSVQFFKSADFSLKHNPPKRTKARKKHQYYLSVYSGTGWHELGDANSPKFGPKYPVYSFGIFGSKVYNGSFRLKAGTTYRFYQSYYNYIQQHELTPYIKNPKTSASNIFISVGGEMLLGHFGAELEMGLNIFKPFYKEFNTIFERGQKGTSHILKSLLPTRLGFKAYAINTARAPQNNLFIGTHINANSGAADYLSITAGYVRKLNL